MTELNYERGFDALQHRQYQVAIMYFTKALDIEKSSSTFHNRAFAYMNLGEKELAKRDYESVVKITNVYIEQADKSDGEYIDICLRDIISAKATIAHIEMENKNFLEVELLCNELINLYCSMHDNSILRQDLHVSNFYSNRGMAKLGLNKIEDATNDFGIALIESTLDEKKEEILFFAQKNGFLNGVKKAANNYSFSKNNTTKHLTYINFKSLGLEIKIPVIKVDDLNYNFPIPRPIPKDNYLSEAEYTMNVAKQEFIDDIKFQIPKSLDKIPNSLEGELEAIAFESLYLIIQKHIQQFGRILPVDLDSYIGQNILLFNAILQAQGKQTLNKEEQEERFSKFNYMAFGMLPENLKTIYSTPI